MQNQRAASLTKQDNYQITLENGAVLNAKSVVLATGARWREMNVPGERVSRPWCCILSALRRPVI